ncbi:MAG: VOC family protein, partial [Planctomycetota bacterium]|jgi:catechol 2,3-dioxygenase-like lactoylglutathione lyase family enzyme
VPEASLEGVHLTLPGHGPDGPTLEIFTYGTTEDRPEGAPNARGLGHLAFEVDDVAGALADVLAHGGRAVGEVTEREVQGVGRLTFVYARDPEGNVLEIQAWA